MTYTVPICLIVDFTKKNREIELSKLAFLKFNSQKNCEIELHTTYFISRKNSPKFKYQNWYLIIKEVDAKND